MWHDHGMGHPGPVELKHHAMLSDVEDTTVKRHIPEYNYDEGRSTIQSSEPRSRPAGWVEESRNIYGPCECVWCSEVEV